MIGLANGHGGKRVPHDPAPVSGPGSLSRRTDGGPAQVNAQLPDAAYGEQAAFQSIQSGAPMAAAPPIPTPQMGGAAPTPVAPPVPLTAPTERPDEPISAGAPFGPGPGPSYVRGSRLSDTLARLVANDQSGGLQDLYEIALRKGF